MNSIADLLLPRQHTNQAHDTSTNGTTNSTTGSASSPSNQLNANSFVTLLTAQLQAQDPLNPMDPNQMVNELVAMNSLQQLIQIQQDLSGGNSTNSSGNANASGNFQSRITLSPATHDAIFQSKIF
jgi:flagellar basal-body rod modification protein FlgD